MCSWWCILESGILVLRLEDSCRSLGLGGKYCVLVPVLTEVFNIIYRCVNCVSICFISSKSARKRWSSAEKDEVRRLFAVHIATQRLPTKKKIETIAQSSTVLKDRLGVLFDNICDFITSADMLLWNLEYSCSFPLVEVCTVTASAGRVLMPVTYWEGGRVANFPVFYEVICFEALFL